MFWKSFTTKLDVDDVKMETCRYTLENHGMFPHFVNATINILEIFQNNASFTFERVTLNENYTH